MGRSRTQNALLGVAIGLAFAVIQLVWWVAISVVLYLGGGMDGYRLGSKTAAILIMFAPTIVAGAYLVARTVKTHRH